MQLSTSVLGNVEPVITLSECSMVPVWVANGRRGPAGSLRVGVCIWHALGDVEAALTLAGYANTG